MLNSTGWGDVLADVFISYARVDAKKVKRLARLLEEAGFSVWWDASIRSGSEFAREIESELEAAKTVLACWTRASVNSNWVRDEASAGVEGNKLLSLTFDGTLPPIGFRQFHCTDLTHWHGKGDDPQIESLVKAVADHVGRDAADYTPMPAARAVRSPLLKWVAMGALLAALVAAGAFWWSNSSASQPVAATAQIVPPRLQVLPIDVDGADPELDQMADRIHDNMSAGLARFPLFNLTATQAPEDAATFRLISSLQREDDIVRLTTRLLDVASGDLVWGQSFDRSLGEMGTLELQDDLAGHVVASVGDPFGAMMSQLHSAVQQKDKDALSPYEALMAHYRYRRTVDRADHLEARTLLEKAAAEAPEDANIHAALAQLIIDEIKHNYNRLPDTGERALAAAQRAVRIDPTNARAYFALAEATYFTGDLGAFRSAAARAVELNRYNSEMLAMLGILSAYGGDWERGEEWTARAASLNPDHPGWYHFGRLFIAYRQGDYEAALRVSDRINQPEYHAYAYTRAIVHHRLGNDRQAQDAGRQFMRLWHDDLAAFRETQLERWFFAQPDLQRVVWEDLNAVLRAGALIE